MQTKLNRKDVLSAFHAGADYCDQAAKLYGDGAALVAAGGAGLDERQAREFIAKVNSLRRRLEGFKDQVKRAGLAIQDNPRLVNKAVRKASARLVQAHWRAERAMAAYAIAIGDAVPFFPSPFSVNTSPPKHVTDPD